MSDEMALPVGTVLSGQFRVTRMLGRGGFGVTYAAEDIQNGRKVAIKEYCPIFCARRRSTGAVVPLTGQDGEFHKYLKDFTAEGEALASFNHSNIVHVQSRFSENGTAYFVMEFLEGQTLLSVCETEGPLPTVAVMLIAEKLVDALKSVHDKGLVHRDIKPENIIIARGGSSSTSTHLPHVPQDVLQRFGRPVLLDFGAARTLGGSGASREMTAIGTEGFGAWEQLVPGEKQDGRTDLYGLAATLYICLCPPRETLPDARQRMSQDMLVPAQQRFQSGAPQSFLRAIDRGLQIRREHRHPDIRAFRSEAFADLNVPEWSAPHGNSNLPPLYSGPYSGSRNSSSSLPPLRSPSRPPSFDDDYEPPPEPRKFSVAMVVVTVFLAVGAVGGGAYWFLFIRSDQSLAPVAAANAAGETVEISPQWRDVSLSEVGVLGSSSYSVSADGPFRVRVNDNVYLVDGNGPLRLPRAQRIELKAVGGTRTVHIQPN